MNALPTLNRVVLNELGTVIDLDVAGRPISPSPTGGLVGLVDVDKLLERVHSHRLTGIDAVDVLGALSGLEALKFVTINDPAHVARCAELVARARSEGSPPDLARSVLVTIHRIPSVQPSQGHRMTPSLNRTPNAARVDQLDVRCEMERRRIARVFLDAQQTAATWRPRPYRPATRQETRTP